MSFTPIQIIVLLFSIFALIKIIVVFTNKKIWYDNIVTPLYKSSNLTSMILSILAFIIFFFLIKELTFAQIFAVMAFTSLLAGIGFLHSSQELLPILKKAYAKKIDLFTIIYTLVWVALIIAVIKEIIFQ